MRGRSWIVILPLMLLAAGIVSAQNPHDFAALRAELEKTDEVIVQAREAVAESGSERALAQLTVAEKFQERAWTLGNAAIADNNVPLAVRAKKFTEKARQRAEQAIAITRQAEENDDFVRRRIEATDEMIAAAQEKLTGDAPAEFRVMFDSARDKQQRALEFLQSRRLKMALQMTLQAQKTLNRVLDGLGLQDKAQKEYEALQERYISLSQQTIASDDPDAEAGRRQAEQLRSQAEQQAADGRFVQAERTLRKAVEILAALQQSAVGPQMIAATLEELNRWADKLGPQVQSSSEQKVRSLYDTARDHLTQGAALSRQGDYERAAQRLQAARQTLSELSNILEH
jgi:flagellin-specific chaperone FliS